MADIVLKDRNGNDIQYPGVERLKLNTVGGAPAEFVDADTIPESLENIPIALDFSEGDQLIEAPEGMAVKSALLQKPETLVPDNIVEGVDIAGIIGAFAVGGGGGGALIASGKYNNSPLASPPGDGTEHDTVTIEHGLGVVPDIVFVSVGGNMQTKYIMAAFGISTAFKAATSFNLFCRYHCANGYGAASNTTIDQATSGASIFNANENTFSFGNSTYKVAGTSSYTWFAIAGLS